jgi:hypothetical protein
VPEGQLEHYAVKLKIPTDGGNPGLYNGRSYDGLYLLKGGGKPAWKLFPRIKREWRKPQGVIFGKRCGCTQNLGPFLALQQPRPRGQALPIYIAKERRC